MGNDNHTESETTDVRYHKIPKFIGDGNTNPQRVFDQTAAMRHAKRLEKAESRLWKAQHLLVILDEYLNSQDGSDECHRAAILVEQVETAVDKAVEQIDRFGTDHGNLFIAYLEAKRKANGADTEAEPETTADMEREINEMAAELKGEDETPHWREADRQREATGNISGSSALEDLMLRLERADSLLMTLNDVEMHGEDRDVISLIAITRSEIAAMNRICEANSKRWN